MRFTIDAATRLSLRQFAALFAIHKVGDADAANDGAGAGSDDFFSLHIPSAAIRPTTPTTQPKLLLARVAMIESPAGNNAAPMIFSLSCNTLHFRRPSKAALNHSPLSLTMRNGLGKKFMRNRFRAAVVFVAAAVSGCGNLPNSGTTEGSSTLARPAGSMESADEDDARDDMGDTVADHTFQEVGDTNRCTEDCSGHDAGFEWAKEKGITDTSECGGKSQSFIEGCEAYAQAVEDSAEKSEEDTKTET